MTPEMVGALQLIAWVTGWMAWGMLAVISVRRYVKEGDVVAEAHAILDEAESIESFVVDFLPAATAELDLPELRDNYTPEGDAI